MWFKNKLKLDAQLQKHWLGKDVFAEVFDLRGKIFREQKNRRTLRFEINGEGYFAKCHRGVGWREIIKNLICGRLPVLGAQQEEQAIARLTQLNIATTPVVGFGQLGFNPARLQSFLITRELTHNVSLEGFCRNWLKHPPAPRLKRALIAEVARIARVLHQNGVNHRDFYICHFLLDLPRHNEQFDPENLHLSLIDLHRAQVRKKTPSRWIIKDVAGLYFSSMDIGLTQRDRLRFLKIYFDQPLAEILVKKRRQIHAIEQRALKLYGKEKQKQFAVLSGVNEHMQLVLQVENSLQPLICEKVLLVIPGQHCAIQTQWGGQTVIIKTFSSKRQAARVLQSSELLTANAIPTPKLLHQAWAQGKTLYVLIFEFVQPAYDWDVLWKQSDDNKRDKLVCGLIAVMANLHNAGLIQCTLTIDNFLISHHCIYLLAEGQVKKVTQRASVGWQVGLKNLALLLAALPVASIEKYEIYYRYYIQKRQMAFTLLELNYLTKWIQQSHRQSLYAYQRKVFSEGQEFVAQKNWRHVWICDWAFDTTAMRILLNDPEAILEGPTAKIMKACATTTVSQVTINGHKLVVKRYNIKGFWHSLRRALRTTRAAISWRSAHSLRLAQIATPKPVAMIEKRYGPLRSTSYYVSEYVAGNSLLDYATEKNPVEELMFIADKITHLFGRLADAQITHGDFKATNILLAGSQPILLDLDALRFHRCAWYWRQAAKRDRKRFMKNWDNFPDLQHLFSKSL